MTICKRRTAIGLMSGTSIDGVDAALIETDGIKIFEFGPFISVPFDRAFRKRLQPIMDRDPKSKNLLVERDLTFYHVDAVRTLLGQNRIEPSEIDVIGFHGQTVFHDPGNKITRQIGNAPLLASKTGINVISNFRSADVAAGGEGAPLAPIFHIAITKRLKRPIAVLNLGGVANITWVSEDGRAIAFDTGPANAMIDDWVRAHSTLPFDQEGQLAGQGIVNEIALSALLNHPYFDRPSPKSLDRNTFSSMPIEGLSLEDGAATLVAFTAKSISRAQHLLPARPLRWLVTGGGRHNPSLMGALRRHLHARVDPVEVVGWDGDALEAQAFAYLAVRSLCRLPLSYPGTTGVQYPVTGGDFYSATHE